MTSLNILVVDRDFEFLKSLKDSLNSKGFSVDTSITGVHAISLIEQNNYNAVITNFHMPVTNGIIIAREAKRINSKTKVIILTDFAFDVVKDVQGYIESDKRADMVLEKDRPLNSFTDIIAKLCLAGTVN